MFGQHGLTKINIYSCLASRKYFLGDLLQWEKYYLTYKKDLLTIWIFLSDSYHQSIYTYVNARFEPTFKYWKRHVIDVRCGTENSMLFLYIVSIIIAPADKRHINIWKVIISTCSLRFSGHFSAVSKIKLAWHFPFSFEYICNICINMAWHILFTLHWYIHI